MSVLLKFTHVVYSVFVCVFVVAAFGVFVTSTQYIPTDSKLAACILPETISSEITINFTDEYPIVRCSYPIKVVAGGTLKLKNSGTLEAQLYVPSLTVENTGKVEVDKTANASTKIVYQEYASFYGNRIAENSVIEYKPEQSAVLGASTVKNTDVKDSSSDKTVNDSQVSQLELLAVSKSTGTANVLQSDSNSVAERFMQDANSCLLETSDCETSDSYYTHSYVPIKTDIVLSQPTGLVAHEASVVANNNYEPELPSVLGVAVGFTDSASLQKRTTSVTISASLDKNAIALDKKNPHQYKVEFEIIPTKSLFDGVYNIYESRVALWDQAKEVTVTYTATGLISNTEYKWRARVVDITANTKSEWKRYSNKSEFETDFVARNTAKITMELDKTRPVIGEAVGATIKLLDSQNNIDTNFVGTIQLSADKGSVVYPKVVIFDASDKGQKYVPNLLKFYENGETLVSAKVQNEQTISTIGTLDVQPSGVNFLMLVPDKEKINKGDKVTIYWYGKGLKTVNFNNIVSPFLENKGIRVSPESTKIYQVTGTLENGEIISASVTIEVADSSSEISTIKTNIPDNITTNPVPVSILNNQSRYDLLTKRDSQTLTDTTKYLPNPVEPSVCPTIDSFSANMQYYLQNSSVKFSWGVRNSEFVYLDNIGKVPAQASLSTSMPSNKEVYLYAKNGNCMISKKVQITVISEQPLMTGLIWIIAICGVELLAFMAMPFSQPGQKFNVLGAVQIMLYKWRGLVPSGVVYDTISSKVVPEAKVLLQISQMRMHALGYTDMRGILWLPQLPSGDYKVKIARFGFSKTSQPSENLHSVGYASILLDDTLHVQKMTKLPFISIPTKFNKHIEDTVSGFLLVFAEEVLRTLSPLVLVLGIIHMTYLLFTSFNFVLLLVYAIILGIPLIKLFVFMNTKFDSGRVELPSGVPLVGVQLNLLNSATREIIAKVKTDAYGRYRFFAKPGKYSLYVDSSSYKIMHSGNKGIKKILHKSYGMGENLMVYQMGMYRIMKL